MAEENRERAREHPAYVTGTSLLARGYSTSLGRPVSTGNSKPLETPTLADLGHTVPPVIPSGSNRAQVECSVSTGVSTLSDYSFAFHISQTVEVCENRISFHSENAIPPPRPRMHKSHGSQRVVDAFCECLDSHPETGLRYEFRETSSRFFFAKFQQSKCTGKLVMFVCDYSWQLQRAEFDIVEEGDVVDVTSANFGFQFELTPDQAYIPHLRTYRHEKMFLKTAMSTHLIIDLRDLAWYMGMVNFRASTVKSFFSKNDHFQRSQISVQKEDQRRLRH